MAEPERRRRRLRRGSSGAPPREPDGGGPPPEPDGGGPPSEPDPSPPVAKPRPTAGHQPAIRPRPTSEPGQVATAPIHDPVSLPPAPRSGPEEREAERGLRGLVGSGASQVSPHAALRARDAARPTDADMAAAERDLVIVRRNWVPREELPPRR
jgi:hypothetical protein